MEICQCIDCGKHLSVNSIRIHRKNSCKAKKQQTKIKNKESQQSLLEAIAKIELGKKISCIIDEEYISEYSLNKEKQEALLLYRRYNECLDK